MAVPTPPGPSFKFGTPQPLFSLAPSNLEPGVNFDAAPDGRFLMLKNAAAGGKNAESLIVVNNWFNEVRARLK